MCHFIQFLVWDLSYRYYLNVGHTVQERECKKEEKYRDIIPDWRSYKLIHKPRFSQKSMHNNYNLFASSLFWMVVQKN